MCHPVADRAGRPWQRPEDVVFPSAALAAASTAEAQQTSRLTDLAGPILELARGALDDAGSKVYAASSVDHFGGNPQNAFQLFEWSAAGAGGSQLTSFADGVNWHARSVSVTDDGQWLAFASTADLTHQNHDESLEIFVMKSDGSRITQLTDIAGPEAGSIAALQISGSGNRVAFISDIDLVGANPKRMHQTFVVDQNGANLRQVSNNYGDDALFYYPTEFGVSISDDGQRVVFNRVSDYGAWTTKVMAVNADGTGLHVLAWGEQVMVSGNGQKVAYHDGIEHIWVIDWTGTGSVALTQGDHPSITDDGLFVFYSLALVGPSNSDGSGEIWKIRTDGTQRTRLTSTVLPEEDHFPEVSGDGSRVAFFRSETLMAMDAAGGNLHALGAANGSTLTAAYADITPDGTRVVFAVTEDPYDSDKEGSLRRIEAGGSGMTEVVSLDRAPARLSVSGDGHTIVFESRADPLGQNPDATRQIFSVAADGTTLLQLTTDESVTPVIAANGSYLVYQQVGGQVFRVRPDGTDLLQLTNYGPNSFFKLPRIDANGEWVLYQHGGQIFRIRTDGSGFEQVTSDPRYYSYRPDVSASGDRITYVSSGDPLGTNADHNYEIFARDLVGGALWQLTFRTGAEYSVDIGHLRISDDGAWVYFLSDGAFFEPAQEDRIEAYRVSVPGGVVERVGALRHGPASLFTGFGDEGQNVVAVDATGNRAVFTAPGNWTDENPDATGEIWIVDQTVPAVWNIGRESPTLLSWTVEPQWLRYDVVRGDVANLAPGPTGTIDLGPVVCLEDDSPDAHTHGFEDAAQPSPGQVFFFLRRGTRGSSDGPGSWGQGSSGDERMAGGGSCGG
jgi:Tol biopolymer transport system component